MNMHKENIYSLIKRIYKVISIKNRYKTGLVLLLMLMHSLLELVFILALSYMAAAVADPAVARNSLAFRVCYRLFPALQSLPHTPEYLLLLAGGMVVFCACLKNSVAYLAARSAALLSEHIALDVGKEIFYRFLHSDYAWHLSQKNEFFFRNMQWRRNIAFLLLHKLSMYTCILTLVILFFSLASQEPVLTSIVVLTTCSVGMFLYGTIRRKIDTYAKHVTKCGSNEIQTLLCATRGIREVLIYHQQNTFYNELVSSIKNGISARVFNAIAPTMPTWLLEMTGFAVVIGVLAYLVFIENADMPRIAMALSLLLLTAWRVLPYANRIVSLQVAIRALYPTVNILLNQLEVMQKLPVKAICKPDDEFAVQERIVFHDISFRYSGAERDALNQVNFEIPVGKKIGIIGPSGAGKSTLVGVLCGLLSPTAGEVLVDGVSLTPERAAAFGMRVGYVPQQPFLFAGTLGENVAFSQWKKGWSEAEALRACRAAAIDFVDTHPLGLRQPIGENGSGLSGGQIQRVSIARALYAHPQILIFDEATSALDQAKENSIQDTIAGLSEEITCVIIAHRLTSVEICDSIVWLDGGKIVMHGPRQDVLAAYRKSLGEV